MPAPSELSDLSLFSSSSSSSAALTADSLVPLLQSRFRSDKPYIFIGSSVLLSINPNKVLPDLNEHSAEQFRSSRQREPHPYAVAGRAWTLLKGRNENQAIVYSGPTASGKTYSARLVTDQLLRLSAVTKKSKKAADHVRAALVVLDSFGNAKTQANANASKHSKYLELHMTPQGHLSSSRLLTFNLDKTRLTSLQTEDRTFHVFYQLLAGATSEERERYRLEDPASYDLLASSGCYRLPGGPNSDDSIGFEELRSSLRTLGFKDKHQQGIFNLLSALLLLGNLKFTEADSRSESASVVENRDVLVDVCSLLGIVEDDLEQACTNQTAYVRKDFVNIVLQPESAAKQRDSLVRDVYAILFAFIIESANHKLFPSGSEVSPQQLKITQIDQPGFWNKVPASSLQLSGSSHAPLLAAYGSSGFNDFVNNFAIELQENYLQRRIFDDACSSHITGDGVQLPAVNVTLNTSCLELLRGPATHGEVNPKPEGIIGVLGKAAGKFKNGRLEDYNADAVFLEEMNSTFDGHASFIKTSSSGKLFGVNHFNGPVTYSASDFVQKDADLFDSAFVIICRQSSDQFISKLFSGPSLAVETHPRDENTVVTSQVSSRPLRRMCLPDGSEAPDPLAAMKTHPVSSQLNSIISEAFISLNDTNVFNIIHMRPTESNQPNSFDRRNISQQLKTMLIPEMTMRKTADYVTDYEFDAFCAKQSSTDGGLDPNVSPPHHSLAIAQNRNWIEGRDYAIGQKSIWLSYSSFAEFENVLAEESDVVDANAEPSEFGDDRSLGAHGRGAPLGSPMVNDWNQGGFGNSAEDLHLLNGSRGPFNEDPNTPAYAPPYNQSQYGRGNGADTPGWGSEWEKNPVTVTIPKERRPDHLEEVPTTATRRWWVRFCWLMTWWIPTIFLTKCGGMKRPDVRMAWREKFTLCTLIFLFCATIIFYIVVLGRLLCPEFNSAFNDSDLEGHATADSFYVSVRGRVYNLDSWWKGDHSKITNVVVSQADMLPLAGLELSQLFPVTFPDACNGLDVSGTLVLLPVNVSDAASNNPVAVHTAGSQSIYTSADIHDENWYEDHFLTTMKDFYIGPYVVAPSSVAAASTGTAPRLWIIYTDKIYDLSDYFNTITRYITSSGPDLPNYSFLDPTVSAIFKQYAGSDATGPLNTALAKLDPTVAANNLRCIQNAFYVGRTDFRLTAKCTANNYILLAFTIILSLTILTKFLAALQFGGAPSPELLDKFVICQVPCYTEGEESLRRTIDSLAVLKYDDKRKLIFIICDGNIIGSGNDRPTPRIVLDILGADEKLDPEPLAFKSIGDGSKQMNFGKVYTGLYECEGHVVPYVVVVKVGKPAERSRPGNRGKRDSQVLLMRYLNRVHFDSPMCPLELEIYHQMRNVIGIDPVVYEYLFMVDADTTVMPESLNSLVSKAADDSEIVGICGETRLDNEEGSWWTMIQVYEYFISHHLAKAFESLFGSVTCLPGCFTMYRIRSVDKGRPLIISNRIIEDYSEHVVDTLHKKNLLSLGEDRYLTTIMMKHFPKFKMKFTQYAIAHTAAPDTWAVLLSQRRRWINSTIHNLAELVNLPDMCGFCCFSMRFIVIIDLVGTIMLPATVVYLVYLIVSASTGESAFPLISIIILAATYGLQAFIFLVKREWQYIGWMIIYLLSYPIWSFFLPVYSFWHFDDFSWGNTRVVVGEGSKKQVITADDEHFEDSMIPLKKFSDYEQEVFETRSNKSLESYSPSIRSQQQSRRTDRINSQNFAPQSQMGDHYRDTNAIGNLKNAASQSDMRTTSQYLGGARLSTANLSQLGQNNNPPYIPMGGSVVGSDHITPYGQPMPMGSQYMGSQLGMQGSNPFLPYSPTGGSLMGGYNTNSMYNPSMMNTVIGPQSGMPSYGSMAQMQRPPSSFSMQVPPVTTNQSANPSDDEIISFLKETLSTADLMQVSMKSIRDSIFAHFPNADLSSRKSWINTQIEQQVSNQ